MASLKPSRISPANLEVANRGSLKAFKMPLNELMSDLVKAGKPLSDDGFKTLLALGKDDKLSDAFIERAKRESNASEDEL